MLIKGKNLYLLVLAFLFFLTFANQIFAQEKKPENAISTKSVSVDYKLTWPGILPDQPLYKLKVLRDKIIAKLIFDPIKKIEWDLIQADKTIYASSLLFDKGNIILAKETALKGEHYFTILVSDYKWAYWKHQGITQKLNKRITTAVLKHQEIFDSLAKKVPQQDKKTFQDVSYFSKLNYQTILNLKLPKDRNVWSVATSNSIFEYYIQSLYDMGIYKPNIFVGLLTLAIALIILAIAFFCIKIIPILYKSLYLGSKNRILKMLNQLKTKRAIKTEKIIYLDGLRGLAAFIVVIYHHLYGFYPKLLYPSEDKILTQISGGPLNIFFNANFAVYIFFILSGYVLTYKFFKTRDYKIIISSAARRYIRLLVPVLFSVVIAFLLMKFSLFFNLKTLSITTCCLEYYNFKPDFFDAIYQAFAGSFFNGQVSYNIVLWTMTYELFGSFLVFGLAALLININRRYIFYGVLIILMLNTVYAPFILGMILADVSTSKTDYLKYIRNNFLTLLALIIGLFLGSFPNNRILDDTLYENMVLRSPIDSVNFYHTWGAFFIMVAIMNSRILKSFFSTRILSFLGKISFAMYVIHFIIVNSFSSFIFINAVRYTSYNNAFLITFVISVTFILFCSYFIYKYIDLTGIRLSKYIFVKYFKKRK